MLAQRYKREKNPADIRNHGCINYRPPATTSRSKPQRVRFCVAANFIRQAWASFLYLCFLKQHRLINDNCSDCLKIQAAALKKTINRGKGKTYSSSVHAK